jgi:nucleotide-binding universal stress UspA family protein
MSLDDEPLPPSVLHPYTGGHTVVYGGYVWELCPDHPKANQFGFVQQHRLVVERRTGRYLSSRLHVHHIDENKTHNASSNLVALTRSEHRREHCRRDRERTYGDELTREAVEQALREGGVRGAARALDCHTQTIRNNFPELVDLYRRKTPVRVDSPEVAEMLRPFAASDQYGYREAQEATGLYWQTILRICQRHDIEWVKKAPVFVGHRGRPRKSTHPA